MFKVTAGAPSKLYSCLSADIKARVQNDFKLLTVLLSHYTAAFSTVYSLSTQTLCYCVKTTLYVGMNLPSIDRDESQTVTRLLNKNERTRAMS